MTFDQLGLSPELLRAVADQGYTEPTPIQAQAIPHVLAGRDVLAGAQTGTGNASSPVNNYFAASSSRQSYGARGRTPTWDKFSNAIAETWR